MLGHVSPAPSVSAVDPAPGEPVLESSRREVQWNPERSRAPGRVLGGMDMTPDDQDSVTRWLEQAKAGDETAARELWRRYFEALVRLARARLRASPRTAEDEEDVALSAFDSFLAGATRGRFPRLEDRHDLWRILVTITTRKAIDQAQRHRRQKRGGGKVFGESALDGEGAGLGDLPGAAPTPKFAALVADDCRRRLDSL